MADDISLDELLALVSSKRARIVLEHIIRNGQITTEELKDLGYNHPPRAARDVRESGIPLITFSVTSSDGRSIAAYKLGDLSQIRTAKSGGRTNFSKAFKKLLYEEYSQGHCNICYGEYAERYLQIDHRIPYEISGDDTGYTERPEDYMLVCGSCNRAKSWSCEHCPNWTKRSQAVCAVCYWANPESYSHIALQEVRRLDLNWSGKEAAVYDALKAQAEANRLPVPTYVKRLLARLLSGH